MEGLPESVQGYLQAVARWATTRDDIIGALLVGSYASGQAGAESDVDLVLICDDPSSVFTERSWAEVFGPTASIGEEEWGRVQSLRVHYRNGLEIEFGMTDMRWLAQPLDAGTAAVLEQGYRIIYEKDRAVSDMLAGSQIERKA